MSERDKRGSCQPSRKLLSVNILLHIQGPSTFEMKSILF